MMIDSNDKFSNLLQEFKVEVCDKSDEVDPGNEMDWYAFSHGWSFAKGLSIDEAHEFSRIVRYTYQYFQ